MNDLAAAGETANGREVTKIAWAMFLDMFMPLSEVDRLLAKAGWISRVPARPTRLRGCCGLPIQENLRTAFWTSIDLQIRHVQPVRKTGEIEASRVVLAAGRQEFE